MMSLSSRFLMLPLILFCSLVSCNKEGCTDPNAKNYDQEANSDDGSCQPYVYGCTDPAAENYNPDADISDSSCEYVLEYTVKYELNTIGGGTFDVFYVRGGETITVNDAPDGWSTTFVGQTGDYVSISCTPPPPQPGEAVSSAYVRITYDGSPLNSDVREYPLQSSADGVLP